MSITRREFVGTTAKAALGISIVPRHVLGGPGFQAPSDTLNIAIVGAGGMGANNAESLTTENIVALCDIDFPHVDKTVEDRQKDGKGEAREKGVKLKEAYSKAKRYKDFRVMLEKEKGIDAVLIATPDHLHATVAATAMRLGKHVYVQKPLTHSIYESRVLKRLADETRVVTQMGNQGHSGEDAHRINAWVRGGAIGPVREVHVWTNRPIWPQGLPRPVVPEGEGSGALDWRRVSQSMARAMGGNYSVPEHVDWDLFLGPAPAVPFHPIYHPFNWRGWVDWGTGALGDMGAHLIDQPFWALELGYPESVEATSSPWGGPSENPVSYPLATLVTYQFGAKGDRPPVRLLWYDGGLMPPRPEKLPDSVDLNREGGVLFVGDKGVLMHDTWGTNPRLYPESLQEEWKGVPLAYARVGDSHEMNWALACKSGSGASCPFDYAAPLTETMLLGLVALRTGQGKKIYYVPEYMFVPNEPEANQYMHREYRAGWEL